METTNMVSAIIPSVARMGDVPFDMNSNGWYTMGGIIALCLLGYLIYTLLKPENF